MSDQRKTSEQLFGTRAPASQQVERMGRCISMAMGCLDPQSENPDEVLAWHRLLDAVEGREPRSSMVPSANQRCPISGKPCDCIVPCSLSSTHSLCAKCGCETKGEAALVDGKVWCHPCADAYPISSQERN